MREVRSGEMRWFSGDSVVLLQHAEAKVQEGAHHLLRGHADCIPFLTATEKTRNLQCKMYGLVQAWEKPGNRENLEIEGRDLARAGWKEEE